jgi:three-Cys-motif partner protein
MSVKNLHEKPFDEGTIVKLELFEEYAKEWLPTFIMSPYKEVWIFDFFAGTGYDIAGTAGSSIRLLQQIKNQIGNIFQQKIKINVCFNEFENDKYNELVESCNRYLDNNKDVQRAINVVYRNCDFNELFPKCLETIKKFPSLVYLDQNGIKFIAEKFILDLEKTNTTDFLYYISSSYFWRFGNTKAFKDVIDIDMEKVKQNPYKYIHVAILNHLKSNLPHNSGLSLYPFTIKKQSGVYGVIFGAKHKRAVDKFLKTVWDMNKLNGAANFDIDDDNSKQQLDLFEGKKPNKIESFSKMLREKVLNGLLRTNAEIYNFAIEEGHIAQHAVDEIKKMKKEGLIDYAEKSPLINYEQVYKNNRLINFIIKHNP